MIPKDFFPNPEGTIGFTINRTNLAMGKYLQEKLENKGFEINMNQWGLLYYLFKNDSLHIKEIPQKFLLSKLEIEKIIEELEKKELILVQKDEAILTLTNKGTKQVFELIPIISESLMFFRGDIPPHEMLITINVLNKIFHNIYPDEELYVLKTPPLFEKSN